MHFRMDDPAYYGIYQIAGSLAKPVYVRTGTSPFPGTSPAAPYTDPRYLEEAISGSLQTIFILGHLGLNLINREHAGLQACIELDPKHHEGHLEAPALGAEGSDPEGDKLTHALRAIHGAGLVPRLIYGSDGPQRPGFLSDYLGRTLQAMERTGYELVDQRMVFL